MPYFLKKPGGIEARRFDGTHENALAIQKWSGGKATAGVGSYEGRASEIVRISTLEGVMIAGPGDWIIRGVKGEFYPCKPDIFDSLYEPAPANFH